MMHYPQSTSLNKICFVWSKLSCGKNIPRVANLFEFTVKIYFINRSRDELDHANQVNFKQIRILMLFLLFYGGLMFCTVICSTVLCYVMLWYISHVMSFHVMSCHLMSYYVLFCVVLCCVVSCRVLLYHVMLCYVTVLPPLCIVSSLKCIVSPVDSPSTINTDNSFVCSTPTRWSTL